MLRSRILCLNPINLQYVAVFGYDLEFYYDTQFHEVNISFFYPILKPLKKIECPTSKCRYSAIGCRKRS